MNKKIKLLISSLGFLSAGIITSSLLLTSCSSSNALPYAPFTALSLSAETADNTESSLSNSNYRLQSKTQEGQFFNTDSTWGNDYSNKWLSVSQIRNLYYSEAQNNTIQFLNTQTNFDSLKSQYKATTVTTPAFTPNDFANKIKPVFFYGATPSTKMKSIAKAYNEINIMSSAFQAASNLAHSIIAYLACNGFDNGSNIDKSDNFSEILNINNKFNTTLAKEFLCGFALTFGEGKNVYHLWPSGFSATISQSISSSDGANQPLSIVDYNSKTLPSQSITFSNIKITYQWFKANQSGGSYISNISDVNNAMTSNQKETLKKFTSNKNTTPGIDSIQTSAFTLPIGNLTFNLIPEYYSYQDPFYSGLFDNVKTGLYKISAPLNVTNSSKTDYNNNPYPTELAATVGQTSVNWRGIVNTNKVTNLSGKIPQTVYDKIKSLDLNTLPYYQSNMNFSASQDKAEYKVATLSNFNVYQLLSLFADPYNKTGTSYKDMPVYNNVNDIEKQNVLNLWAIGWLASNSSNINNIKDVQEYKDFKNQLKFGDDKVSANDFTKNSYYQSGLGIIYQIIVTSGITSSNIITFKN